jgi:hypothetical protein
MSSDLGRRELFRVAAGTAVAATALRAQGSHKFFTDPEFAMVEEISDILIPTDEKSPGAKEAKVAEYLDGQLAEAFDDEERQKMRQGLAVVDPLAQKINNAGFMQGTRKQREAVVLQMAQNEKEPKAPEELFFRLIKNATAQVYYTSKIGIHTDMDYKGNVYQTGEYAGELPSGPALADYHGTK